ncbi:antitoxin [Nocardia macrotermitis]|uniref:antitoxin n=1 Tax=Nocardia macrotermitis TaxID=2585198 RepID=UPI00129505E4|nr:antitoxin [Nocardia macrotermitis]
MRTTIDLPEDLHRQATAIARDTHRSLSETVSVLIRRGLRQQGGGDSVRSPKTGLRTVTLGRVITSEDVRSLEDE